MFDLDGIVVDSAAAHVEAYRVALEAEGVRMTSTARALVLSGAPRTRVLESLDLDASRHASVADRKGEAFRRLLRNGEVKAESGCVEILSQLNRLGVPVGLVSNSREAREVVASLGIGWAFRAIVGRHDVKQPKPSPEPFLIAAARIGVSPERCVAIEDSTIGAEAARRAGAFVVVKGTLGEAHLRIATLSELPLQEWFGPELRIDQERTE